MDAPLILGLEGGAPRGLVPSYLAAAAVQLGIGIELIGFDSKQALYSALASGQVDIAGAVSWSGALAGKLIPTRAYLSLPGGIYTRAATETGYNPQGKELLVVKDSAWHQWGSRLYPESKLIPLENAQTAISQVAAGQGDLYLGDRVGARYLMDHNHAPELALVENSALVSEFRVAAPLNAPLLAGLMQKALDAVPGYEIDKILRISPVFGSVDREAWNVGPMLAWLAAGVAWLLLWVWGFVRLVQRKTVARTRTLRQALHQVGKRERQLQQQMSEQSHSLEMLEARLELFGELMPGGEWSWDAELDRLQWSEGMYKLFGLEPGAFDGSQSALLALIHPQDRERVAAAFGGRLDDTEGYRISYRVAGDQERTLVCFGFPKRDASGEIIRISGFTWDISDYLRQAGSVAGDTDSVEQV
jgi:PAS domain-containing protein